MLTHTHKAREGVQKVIAERGEGEEGGEGERKKEEGQRKRKREREHPICTQEPPSQGDLGD